MMRHLVLPILCLNVVLFSAVKAPASEPASKPAKTRLVPRALPGNAPAISGGEEHLAKKPVIGGAPGSVGAGGQFEEKAHIGVIRRAVGEGPPGGQGPNAAVPTDAPTGDKAAPPGKSALPPVRPGQIRVLPKSKLKTDAGSEVTAQYPP